MLGLHPTASCRSQVRSSHWLCRLLLLTYRSSLGQNSQPELLAPLTIAQPYALKPPRTSAWTLPHAPDGRQGLAQQHCHCLSPPCNRLTTTSRPPYQAQLHDAATTSPPSIHHPCDHTDSLNTPNRLYLCLQPATLYLWLETCHQPQEQPQPFSEEGVPRPAFSGIPNTLGQPADLPPASHQMFPSQLETRPRFRSSCQGHDRKPQGLSGQHPTPAT